MLCNEKWNYAINVGSILSWLTLTGIVVSFNAVLAQSDNLSSNAANKTAEYFRIDYNYTNFADCSPACKDITVHYDSATNELSLNDWMRPENVVIIKHLTDEQEKILETLSYHYNLRTSTDLAYAELEQFIVKILVLL